MAAATQTDLSTDVSVVSVDSLPALTMAVDAGQLIPLDKFANDLTKAKRVAEYEASVSLKNSNSIDMYGTAARRQLSKVLDDLLRGISTTDLGEAGELVVDVVTEVKAMGLPALKKEAQGQGSILAALPLIGPYFSAFRRFRAMHQSASKNLQIIEDKANTYLAKLKAGHALYDRLFDATDADIDEMEIALAGGQQAMLRLRDEFERERAAVAGSRDPRRLTLLRDMVEQINAFESQLARMHAAYMDGLLTLPEVRAAQQAQRTEMRNTLGTIYDDIPRIKKAVIRIATLRQLSKATDATKARKQLARELDEIGSKAQEDAFLKAKESEGDFSDDVVALATRAERLLATLDKGLELDRINHDKREQGVRQLSALRDRLADGLYSHAERVAFGA